MGASENALCEGGGERGGGGRRGGAGRGGLSVIASRWLSLLSPPPLVPPHLPSIPHPTPRPPGVSLHLATCPSNGGFPHCFPSDLASVRVMRHDSARGPEP